MEDTKSEREIWHWRGEERRMGNFYAFHQSVLGHLHKRKGLECEDRSESENGEGESGQFYIAVVADGHGDTACMRSKDGAQIAARVAREQLSEFAKAALCKEANESIKEQLENGRQRDILKTLTDNIVAEWSKEVDKDLKEKPLTEEELNQSGSYADAYRNNDKLRHIYGTTLLAALLLPDYLILLQQGDGRCVVFYKDKEGTPKQPITLDERCHENVTTSMCDEDAPLSLLKHSVVIPLHEKKIMSCWLGCDGVEDSYRNDEGIYTFYRKLMCELNEWKENGFEDHLKGYLREFSEIGSGDDISVGGIVDMDCIGDYVPSFALQVEEYGLAEDLERLKNKHISMSRKHGLLQKQAEQAKKLYEQLYNSDDLEKTNDARGEYQKAEDAFKAYDNDYKKIQEQIDEVNGQIQECKERRRNLEEETKKKQELEKQTLQSKVTGQRTIVTHSETKTPKKTDGKEELPHGAVAHSIEILSREMVSQNVGIILLGIVLLLALIVLLLSMRPAETVSVISSEPFRGIFDKIFGK